MLFEVSIKVLTLFLNIKVALHGEGADVFVLMRILLHFLHQGFNF